MNASSLERKTIRPGSLTGYSYYHSSRQPVGAASRPIVRPLVSHKSYARIIGLALAVMVLFFGFSQLRGEAEPGTGSPSASQAAHSDTPTKAAPAVAAPAAKNYCAANTLDRFILVSVSKRHLWACEQAKTVHEAPVITGMLNHPSTLTPAGTYEVYAKTTETTLTGTDETGSWNRPVHYWMPFLNNEHGTYGFHDATWRADNEFGKVDPASDKASHGCVELPLASMQWLYNWSNTGTTLTIES